MTDKTDSKEREALVAYLKDCDAHDIVPDVGGAWHAAFQAGRASLAASAGSELVEFQLPPTPFKSFAPGVEIGYDLFGGADIRLGGEFVYVHINYDWRYTHNAARMVLAEQIAGILSGALVTHPSPPEGMVMVPKEPTMAMRIAAKTADMDHTNLSDWMVSDWPEFNRIWDAMLKAAPPTSSADSGKGE